MDQLTDDLGHFLVNNSMKVLILNIKKNCQKIVFFFFSKKIINIL